MFLAWPTCHAGQAGNTFYKRGGKHLFCSEILEDFFPGKTEVGGAKMKKKIRKFEDFPLLLPFTSEEGKVNFFWETVRGMAVFHFLCLGGREGGEKRETDDDALQLWALLENSTKFSFSYRTGKKISRVLNNVPPRFIGFANHCMQPPLWQNKHVGQRENDFERKPPSFLQPTLSLLFRSESSSLRCQLPKRHTEEKRKGFFLVFIFHLLLWESSGGISGNFSPVSSPEAPLRSKLAKWLIARPGITTPPYVGKGGGEGGDTHRLTFPLVSPPP